MHIVYVHYLHRRLSRAATHHSCQQIWNVHRQQPQSYRSQSHSSQLLSLSLGLHTHGVSPPLRSAVLGAAYNSIKLTYTGTDSRGAASLSRPAARRSAGQRRPLTHWHRRGGGVGPAAALSESDGRPSEHLLVKDPAPARVVEGMRDPQVLQQPVPLFAQEQGTAAPAGTEREREVSETVHKRQVPLFAQEQGTSAPVNEKQCMNTYQVATDTGVIAGEVRNNMRGHPAD